MQNKLALVVDDSRVARMTLARLLQSHGFDVVESDSGEAAIQHLQQDHAKPAVVFMDVMMGGMDGLSATRQIKVMPGLETLPVVICTGNDTDADRDKALATGAIAVLSKPPAAEDVNHIIDELASLALAQAEITTDTTVQTQQFDETALMREVLQAVEQQLLPELKQQVRHVAEDISRQIAADAAEAAIASQSQSLLPDWTRQVTDSVSGTFEDVKQSLTGQVVTVANQAAAKAIDVALEQYGLTEKVMSLLRGEGSNWLRQQQQTLQDELLNQLRQEMEPMVNRYLDANLTPKITPIINSNVKEMFAELTTQQQAQMDALRQDVKQLRLLNIGVAVVAVVALVVALL